MKISTSFSSFSICTARCTMGPLTAYSTFLIRGFIVSKVSTFPRRDATPFSDILQLIDRRVADSHQGALPKESDSGAGTGIAGARSGRQRATECRVLHTPPGATVHASLNENINTAK